ncbi:hypothetical protein BH11VER1_BH11VER1_37380 [soil metagenome]
MNTTPTIKVTEEGPKIGVAIARLLLQHALKKEKQTGSAADPDTERKQALNQLTGASIFLPPEIPPAEEPTDPPQPADPTVTPPVSFKENQP